MMTVFPPPKQDRDGRGECPAVLIVPAGWVFEINGLRRDRGLPEDGDFRKTKGPAGQGRKMEKRDYLKEEVRHIDIKKYNVVPLVEAMRGMSFPPGTWPWRLTFTTACFGTRTAPSS